MESPLKRVLVFDFETGGFSYRFNSITELAVVSINLETLEIIEEKSVLIKPYIDFSFVEREDFKKEAKRIFNTLAISGSEGVIKSLIYKEKLVTLKNLDELTNDLEKFISFIDKKKLLNNKGVLTFENYVALKENQEYSEVLELYFKSCYEEQALEATHISIELLINEGVSYEEAHDTLKSIQAKNTIGNNKPIMAGHNIKNFDLDFAIKLYSQCGSDFLKLSNALILDTLELARLRWFELSSFSLGVCANSLGLTLKEAHRALPDTIANAKVLISFLTSMRSSNSDTNKSYVRPKYNFDF